MERGPYLISLLLQNLQGRSCHSLQVVLGWLSAIPRFNLRPVVWRPISPLLKDIPDTSLCSKTQRPSCCLITLVACGFLPLISAHLTQTHLHAWLHERPVLVEAGCHGKQATSGLCS